MWLPLMVVVLAAGDGGAEPKSSMHDAFEALVRLQAVAARRGALQDPKLAPQVKADLATLTALSHAFPADAPAQEPATAALSALFSRYAAETQHRFENGAPESVALRVRTLMGLCFSCHSRERAADFQDALRRVDGLGLTGLERATVLAATRQFDAALGEYQQVLDGPATDFPAYARALQDALTLEVRVKDDPAATLALLDRLSQRTELPKYFQLNVPSWKRDAQAWQAEHFDAQRATPEQLFSRAQALVRSASAGPGFADERRDVQWLRASAYLNLALAKNPKLATRGEALDLLGQCASSVHASLWWDLDALFWETCVRENPRTPVARRCFERLSERVTLGYTGSGGTFIPDDELQRLADLKALLAPGRK